MVNPSHLWGLLLLGVPIVLYFLRRRPEQSVAWAAYAILQKAVAATEKRNRRHENLLLFFRLALLGFLCLAAADPLLPAGSFSRIMGGEELPLVIVMDATASMHAVGDEGLSSFERARQRALEVLDRLSDSVPVSLLRASVETTVLCRESGDRESIRRRLLALRPGFGALDPGKLIEQLESFPRESQVHWFTDGAGPWIRFPDPLTRQIRVREGSLANTSIEELSLVEPEDPLSAETPRLLVKLSRVGEDLRSEASCWVDGELHWRGELDVIAEDGSWHEIAIPPLSPGHRLLRFELSPDSLDLDNRAWLPLPPSTRSTLHLLEGPHASAHLSIALETLAGSPSFRRFQLNRVAPGELQSAGIGPSDLLVVQGFDPFPHRLEEEVLRTLKGEAGFLWFLESARNRTPLQLSKPSRLFPLAVEGHGFRESGSEEPELPASLATERPDHPLWENLLRREPASLSRVQIRTWAETRPLPGAEVLARVFPAEDPAILLSEPRRIAVSFSLNPEASDFGMPSPRGTPLLSFLESALPLLLPSTFSVHREICGLWRADPGRFESRPGAYREEGTTGGWTVLRTPPEESELGFRVFPTGDGANPPVPRESNLVTLRWSSLVLFCLFLLGESLLATRRSKGESR